MKGCLIKVFGLEYKILKRNWQSETTNCWSPNYQLHCVLAHGNILAHKKVNSSFCPCCIILYDWQIWGNVLLSHFELGPHTLFSIGNWTGEKTAAT